MKKQGFTLVELLAVLIVLGVIALIITPKIITTLDEAEKNTVMESARGLIQAAEYKYSSSDMLGAPETVTINYTKNSNINYLDYKGDKPEAGQIVIRDTGEIAMAVRFGDYCYIKPYNKNDIEIVPYKKTTCGANSYVFVNVLNTLPEVVTSGDGLYASKYVANRYIYRGKLPNNWLWLDENGDNLKTETELYRIVAFEADGTIKVVRHNSIGGIAWDVSADKDDYALPWNNGTKISVKTRQKTDSNTRNTYCTASYGCNVWGTQSSTYIGDEPLENIDLGEFRYKYYPNTNETTTLTLLNGGSVQDKSSLNMILNEHWINYLSESVKDSIVTHPFYVGGVYPNKKGNDEETQFRRELEEQNTYIWQEADESNKIALVNITDVVESSLNPNCTSVWANYYYNNDNVDLRTSNDWPCKYENGNWLHKKNESDNSHYWSLSAYSYNRYSVWFVGSAGYFYGNSAHDTHGVRPAFYLKSSIQLAGYGTHDEPYTIYLEDEPE